MNPFAPLTSINGYVLGVGAAVLALFVAFVLLRWVKWVITLDPSEATCHVCGSIQHRTDMNTINALGVEYLLCAACSTITDHG